MSRSRDPRVAHALNRVQRYQEKARGSKQRQILRADTFCGVTTLSEYQTGSLAVAPTQVGRRKRSTSQEAPELGAGAPSAENGDASA